MIRTLALTMLTVSFVAQPSLSHATTETCKARCSCQKHCCSVSGGLNLFSHSGRNSGFAKLDVSFGDDLTGVGKLGVTVASA